MVEEQKSSMKNPLSEMFSYLERKTDFFTAGGEGAAKKMVINVIEKCYDISSEPAPVTGPNNKAWYLSEMISFLEKKTDFFIAGGEDAAKEMVINVIEKCYDISSKPAPVTAPNNEAWYLHAMFNYLAKKTDFYSAGGEGAAKKLIIDVLEKCCFNSNPEKAMLFNKLLIAAAKTGRFEIAYVALKNGANVNASLDGMTALAFAVSSGHRKVVQLLLDHQAEVNVLNHQQRTPLMTAIYYQRNKIMKLLLKRGANVNFKTTFGSTPLAFSITNRNITAVRALLAYEVDVNFKSPSGLSPLSLAKKFGFEEIVTILEMNNAVD